MWFTPLLGSSQQLLPEIPSILRLPTPVLNRQPVTTPVVDWGNPITRGLNAWQVGPHLQGATLVNAPTIVSTDRGRVNNFVDSSSQALHRTMPRTGGGVNNITVVALAKISTGTIVSIGDSTSTQTIGIELGPSRLQVQRLNTGGDVAVFTSPANSNWNVFTFTWSTAGVLAAYYNGNFSSSGTIGTWPNIYYDILSLGARYTNSTFSNYGTGQCALALVFNRELSAREIKSISTNPWQVFQAHEKRVFTFPARQTITRPVADVPWPSLNILSHKIKNQQQPQSTPQIDRSNPITKDLLDWQTADFLNGFTPVNSPATSYSHRGKAKNFVGASTQYLTKDLPASISNLNTTIVCVARGSGTGQLAGWGNSSVQFSVGIEYYLSALIWMRSYNAASSNNSLSGPYDTNWHVHIGIINQSGIMEYYRDGIAGTNNGPAQGGNGNVNRLYIGARSWGGTYSEPFTGDVALTAFFRRTLTMAEIKSISENPWQIFKGHTKYIPLYSPPWKGVPDSTNLYDDIDDSRDEDYIVSPDITYGSITSPTIFTLDKFLAPGQYSIKVRARKTATYGEVRSVLLDSYDRVVGTSKWQGLTNSFSTYNLPVTTSETAYRIKVEAQRSIIQDGLALYLDPSNPQSYPGTGTTLTDLSGNGRTGTLVNGPIFKPGNYGAISFDGTDDYVNIPGMSTSFGGSGGTFLVWLKRNGNQNDYSGVFWSRVGALYHGICFMDSSVGNVNQLQYAWNGLKSRVNLPDLIVPDRTWVMAVVRGYGTWGGDITLYKSDSKFTYFNGVNHGGAINLSDLKLAAEGLIGGRYFKGDIGIAAMYSRAISDAEIQENFNATRHKYGV